MTTSSALTLTLLLSAASLSSAFAEGESIPFEAYTLADQHGNEHRIHPETRTVIMSFEMSLSKALHKMLATKDPDYLETHKAEYVADISGMPRVITKLFAGPKMKRYKFPIILAKDKGFAAAYPHVEGKITVFSLDASREKATVQYVAGPAEIEALLEPGKSSAPADAMAANPAEK